MNQLLPIMGERRKQRIIDCINSYSIKQKGKLSEKQVEEIKKLFKEGMKPKEIAKKYPVSFWRIYQLVR